MSTDFHLTMKIISNILHLSQPGADAVQKRKELPSVEELNRLFRYDTFTGYLHWKPRPVEIFADLRSAKNWNTKYADKVAGCDDGKGAIVVRLSTLGSIYAHRVIYKMITGEEPSHIDHIDGNPLNNRFTNLRPADDTKNAYNMKGHSEVSGLKGVYFHKNLKNRPWRAGTHKDGVAYSGGYYSSKEGAFRAASVLRRELHGEFARHDHRDDPEPRQEFRKHNKRDVKTHIKSLLKNKDAKYTVHYMDGDRTNKDHSNIVVCPDNNYQRLIEQRTRAYEACGHADWIKCIYCKQYDDPKNLYQKKENATYRPEESCYRFHKECQLKYQRELRRAKKT